MDSIDRMDIANVDLNLLKVGEVLFDHAGFGSARFDRLRRWGDVDPCCLR